MPSTPWHGLSREDDPSDDYREEPESSTSAAPVDRTAGPEYDYDRDEPPQSLARGQSPDYWLN